MSLMQQEDIRQLTAMDRCDKCNAQAFVLANGVSGDLLFCAHHFNKWEDRIREFAFEIIDERHLINAKSEAAY